MPWGQSKGFVIMVTTAIPGNCTDGFPPQTCFESFLRSGLMKARISAFFGTTFSRNSLQISSFSFQICFAVEDRPGSFRLF